MRNIIIVTKGTNTYRVSIDTTTNKVKTCWFDPAIKGDKNDSRINALAATVKTMQQLQENNVTDLTCFYSINLVNDFISNGTALAWAHNGNKKLDGTPANEVEMALWTEFYALYSSMIQNVIFKDQTTVSNIVKNNRSQYPITEDMKNIAKYINQAWEQVESKSAQLEEEETDCI